MNMIHSTQLVIAVCLILCGSVNHRSSAGTLIAGHSSFQDQKATEWQRFTVSGEEFSVLLPVVPTMNTVTLRIDEKTDRRERVLAAYWNGVVYAIYTFEGKSLSLDELNRRFTHDNEPARQTEPVTVDGITGTSSRFEKDERMSAIQFFATDKNLYVFQVVGSKLGNPLAGIPKFLSSIKFSNQPEGRNVVDGAGEQSAANTDPTQSGPVLSGRQVDLKVSVITKPEPRYTEEARKNQITGTIVLRTVFSSSGAVTNIKAVSNLPDGLTERAIEAAGRIRFIPAIKDGRFVSMWIQLEYNFNLY